MTDLQKDQAIYQALMEIAKNVFNHAAENNTQLQKFLKENRGKVTLADINKLRSTVYNMINDATMYNPQTKEGLQSVNVDTFSCAFPPMKVFELLKYWKSLAKVKGDIFFTYEEKVSNRRIGSVDIYIDNPAGAKTLATCTIDDDDMKYRQVLNTVLAEINITTGDIHFVSTDGKTFAVISNNTENISVKPGEDEKVLQALFSKDDWKRICDHAAKNGSVKFKLYERNEGEHQDTMVAIIGDTTVKSLQESVPYPNWHKVIQKNANKHFRIHHAHVKASQKWINSFKGNDKERNIFVSFYRGSQYVYFDFQDIDYGRTKTAMFLLDRPSETTCGIGFKIQRLQKMKFSGFKIENFSSAGIIDCDDVDFMMLMPMRPDDGHDCTFDVEKREVVAQLAVA